MLQPFCASNPETGPPEKENGAGKGPTPFLFSAIIRISYRLSFASYLHLTKREPTEPAKKSGLMAAPTEPMSLMGTLRPKENFGRRKRRMGCYRPAYARMEGPPSPDRALPFRQLSGYEVMMLSWNRRCASWRYPMCLWFPPFPSC